MYSILQQDDRLGGWEEGFHILERGGPGHLQDVL